MEVHVRCLFGLRLTIPISTETSVLALKHILSDRTSIPAAIQSLESNGKVLPNNACVAGIKLARKRGITQSLDLRSQFSLNFHALLLCGDSFVISVLISDKLQILREKVANVLGVDRDSVRIAMKGKVLKDSETVADWYEPGEFVLEVLRPEEFFVRIRLGDGRCMPIAVSHTFSIAELLSRLSKQHSIDPTSQCLQMRGCELFPEQFLSSLSIQADAFLSLSPLPSAVIFARSLGHECVEISWKEAAFVGDVAAALEKRVGRSRLVLTHRGKVLCATSRLEEIGIVPGTILEYGEVAIHARTSNIESVTMPVCADVPFAAVSSVLASRLHLQTFKVGYKGEELTDRDFLCGWATEITLEIIAPTDSYVWVKSASELIRINIADFSISIAELARYFKALTGSIQEVDCALYGETTMDLQQSLSSQRISPGSAIRLLNTAREKVVSVVASGKSRSFTLPKTETLATLQEKIAKKWRIPQNTQKLFFKGIRLGAGQRVADLPEPCLQLLEEGEKLIIFTNLETDQVCFTPCKPTASVLSLKAYLSKQWSLPPESFSFVWKKKTLEDNEIFGELAGDTVFRLLVCSPEIRFVRLKCNSRSHFIVVPSFNIPVTKLKSLCAQFVTEPFSLYCKCAKMEEDMQMSYYSILLNSSISAVGPKDVMITVSELRGTKHLFIMEKQQVLFELMKKIQRKMGHSIKGQIIIAGRQEISDTYTPVGSLPSEILVLHDPEQYAFLASYSKGEQLFFFGAKETVQSIVHRIAKIRGLHTDEFVLVCKDIKLRACSNLPCDLLRNGTRIELFTSTDPVLIINRPSNTVVKKQFRPTTPLSAIISDLNLLSSVSLYCNCEELDSSLTPKDYGLTACSDLSALIPRHILVPVATQSRSIVRVIVEDEELKAYRVQEAVATSMGVPKATLRLYSHGVQCTYSESIRVDGGLLVLSYLEVMVHACISHNKVNVALRADQAVGEMRILVAEALKCRPELLQMMIGESLLNDDAILLSTYKFQEDGLVKVLEPEDVCITVQYDTFHFQIAQNRDNTVKQLAVSVAAKVRDAPTALVYERQFMIHSYTLQDCGIHANSTVHALRVGDCIVSLENQLGDGFILKGQRSALKLSSLTSAVTDRTGVSAAEQSFSCTVELCTNLTIADYRLPDSVQLFLIHSQASVPCQQTHVLIKHSGRKLAHLQVAIDCCIGDFRKSVEKKTGFVVNRLIIAGQVAQESSTLAEYNLSPKTNVTVVLENEHIAEVRLTAQDSFHLPIHSGMSLRDIKSMIKEVTDIPQEYQLLTISEKELTDNDLQSCSSDMSIAVRLIEEMVFIQTLSGNRLSVRTSLGHTVLQLKSRIASKLSLISTHQRLYYMDEELADARLLSSYGLQPGSTMMLLRPGEVRVFVKSVLGGFFTGVKRNARIDEVKWEVAKRCGLRKEDVRLFAAFTPVQEEHFPAVLSTAQLVHMRVDLCMPDLLLLLCAPDGKMVTLHSSPSETIAGVCQKATAVTQIENIGLRYHGRKLLEEMTVAECGLVSMAVLSIA